MNQKRQILPIQSLKRQLITTEKQAYEGAKSFYYCFLPVTMVSIAVLYLYVLELKGRQDVKETNQNEKSLLKPFVLVLLYSICYSLALRVYKSCNAVETTPVQSLTQLDENIITNNEEITTEKGLLDGKQKPSKHYCNVCKITCDYRTKHCKKCQICIERFDHHCFWIGNCVGRHNHRAFYLFLVFQTGNNVFIFWALYLLPTFLSDYGVIFPSFFSWTILALQLLVIGFIAFTGYLWIYHTMLISNGITTWEHMRRFRISYLKYLPIGHNPFSKGVIQNWKIFFSQPTRYTGHSTVQNWEPLVPTFEESERISPSCNLIENEYYSCC